MTVKSGTAVRYSDRSGVTSRILLLELSAADVEVYRRGEMTEACDPDAGPFTLVVKKPRTPVPCGTPEDGVELLVEEGLEAPELRQALTQWRQVLA